MMWCQNCTAIKFFNMYTKFLLVIYIYPIFPYSVNRRCILLYQTDRLLYDVIYIHIKVKDIYVE